LKNIDPFFAACSGIAPFFKLDAGRSGVIQGGRIGVGAEQQRVILVDELVDVVGRVIQLQPFFLQQAVPLPQRPSRPHQTLHLALRRLVKSWFGFIGGCVSQISRVFHG